MAQRNPVRGSRHERAWRARRLPTLSTVVFTRCCDPKLGAMFSSAESDSGGVYLCVLTPFPFAVPVSDSCFRNLAEDRSGVNLKDLVHDPSL